MNTTTVRLVMVAAALLFMGLFAEVSARPPQAGSTQLLRAKDRKLAPAAALPDERGKRISLSDYRGKVVLLDFWATDCGGCRLEIPGYVQLEAAYKDKAFAVVGVSMDNSYENLANAREAWDRVDPFAQRQKINYTLRMADSHASETYASIRCLLPTSSIETAESPPPTSAFW